MLRRERCDNKYVIASLYGHLIRFLSYYDDADILQHQPANFIFDIYTHMTGGIATLYFNPSSTTDHTSIKHHIIEAYERVSEF